MSVPERTPRCTNQVRARVYPPARYCVAPFNLRIAGQNPPSCVPGTGIPAGHAYSVLMFVQHFRARADQRHIPAQNVPELRQLIQPPPAQETPDMRHAVIRVPCGRASAAPPHRAEFADGEGLAVRRQPLLPEDDVSAVLHANRRAISSISGLSTSSASADSTMSVPRLMIFSPSVMPSARISSSGASSSIT